MKSVIATSPIRSLVKSSATPLVMSLAFIFSMLGFSTPSQAGGHAHMHMSHDRPSVHGMMMMGKETVYLSHLPMFHSPHDYQALLEVEIDGSSKQAYMKNQLSSGETVYTLVPESFVLPDMIAHPHPFKAQIFKGHFERGGKVIASNTTVTIKKVLHFRKLDSGATKPVASTQLLFGNEREQFLAHMLHGPPDFDQILSVKAPAEIASTLAYSPSLIVTAQDQPNSEPLNDSASLEFVDSNEPQSKMQIDVLKSLYLEFGDLAM